MGEHEQAVRTAVAERLQAGETLDLETLEREFPAVSRKRLRRIALRYLIEAEAAPEVAARRDAFVRDLMGAAG